MPFLPQLPHPARVISLTGLFQRCQSHIPFRLKQALLQPLLNRLFREQLQDGEFYFLEGRLLGLEVKDLGITLAFGCHDEQIRVVPADRPDAWIRGNKGDFIQLANQAEDPDTLFFQRRLSIEGDTELGLAVKNLLDSVDWSEMPALFQRSLKLMQQFQSGS